ncbi:hypothetical protein D3C76_1552590 [compost metagenome]
MLTRRMLAQPLDQRHATLLRHAQVRDDQRNIRMTRQMLQRNLDRSRRVAIEPFTLQQLRQLKQGILFVIDQKKLLAWLCERIHKAIPAMD